MATRLAEEYPWEKRSKKIAINYSGMIIADGKKLFGDNQEQYDNEEMFMRAANGLQDRMPEPSESDISFQAKHRPLRDECQEAMFDGVMSYAGLLPHKKVFSDSLKTVVREKSSDAYPWETSPKTVIAPICNANVIKADGSHVFGDTLEQTHPEILNIGIRREFADNAQVNDALGKSRLSQIHSEHFAGFSFDGQLRYAELNMINRSIYCGDTYREEFRFVCVRS